MPPSILNLKVIFKVTNVKYAQIHSFLYFFEIYIHLNHFHRYISNSIVCYQ